MVVYDLVIKNGNVVMEEDVIRTDLAIKNGKIVRIASSVEEKAEKIINANGLHIFPGVIDTHVHFNEPGRTQWEGIETGSKSLAAGGGTTFFDMPLNSYPATISEEAFQRKEKLAKEKSIVPFHLWGGVVPGNKGEIEKLHNAGVIGFKAFMSDSGIEDFQAADDLTLFEAMKEISRLNSILAVHAESEIITKGLTVEKPNTPFSASEFSDSRPIYSEVEAVQRILAYAQATNCNIHIVHISSHKVLPVILSAKKKGIDVTVETCPHYLSLTVEDLQQLGAIAKCAPPLRNQEDVDGLWTAIFDGEIDIIGSDHSPSLPSMKNGDVQQAWGGISGCQSILSILIEEGYWKRNIPLPILAKIASINPAKRFGLYPQKGAIKVGSDANLTIVDVHKKFRLNKEDLYYRYKQSPYIGREFHGKIMNTLVKGITVYSSEGFS